MRPKATKSALLILILAASLYSPAATGWGWSGASTDYKQTITDSVNSIISYRGQLSSIRLTTNKNTISNFLSSVKIELDRLQAAASKVSWKYNNIDQTAKRRRVLQTPAPMHGPAPNNGAFGTAQSATILAKKMGQVGAAQSAAVSKLKGATSSTKSNLGVLNYCTRCVSNTLTYIDTFKTLPDTHSTAFDSAYEKFINKMRYDLNKVVDRCSTDHIAA